MAQHFPHNMLAHDAWCGKCKKQTSHRVDRGLLGPCLACIDRLEAQHAARRPAPAKQEGFDFAPAVSLR